MYLKAGCCFWLLLTVLFFLCVCRCCLTLSSLPKERPSRTWRTQTECLSVEMTLQRDRKLSVLCVLFMSTGCPKKKSSQPIPGHQNFRNWLVLLAVVCNEQSSEAEFCWHWVIQLGKTGEVGRTQCMSKDTDLFQFSADLANRWFWLSMKSFSHFYCC